MLKMTPVEARAFLAHGTRTGKVATVREDGRPHVTPIWFVLDGDDLVFTTWHESIKAANLQRDGRLALCVDDETPPFAYVVIEGEVRISEDLPSLRYWATRIAARTMGSDLAAAYGARNGIPGEWLVRVRPTKIIGYKDMAA